MNLHSRTLPLAALLGLALVAGCDPKTPKVTEDQRPPAAKRDPAVAVPAARTASMAAGAGELAQGAPAATGNRAQAAPGGDAPSKAAADASAPRLNSQERTFVQTAAGLGLYEIAAAQLGQERAQAPAVKAYAEHLQRDHAKAQEQLQQLAGQHRIELPRQMPPDRLTVIERLQRSEPFDTAFVNTVGVQDHRSTIDRFEKAARDARDPALKGWIQQTLASLREHLAEARKLPGANSR
jgi:putative membrane protein